MTWNPQLKEIESLETANSKARYKYFLNHVCDSERIFGLYSDGWAILGDLEDRTLIPFWPHQIYAERFKNSDWSDYQPTEISLIDFINKWIPGMKEQGVGAAIFPVGSGDSIVVSLDDLEANLRFELDKY